MRALLGIFMALLVFFLNVLEAMIRRALRSGRRARPSEPSRRLSPREQVLELERIRQRRGYKPGWLYYRCRELGLEDTLRELQDEQTHC